MELVKDEIVKSYKNASDKGKQIGVLAELNSTTKQKILTILSAAGVLGSTTEEKKPFRFTDEIDAKIMGLAEQKLTYAEIAESLNLTVSQVNNRLWLLRKREKEKRNSVPGEVKTYQQPVAQKDNDSNTVPNVVVDLVTAELERVNLLFEPVKSEYEDLKKTRDELIAYLDSITHTKTKTL